jgi:DNA or RNA helicases of superfamily II
MIAARMLDQVEADRQVGAVTLAPHQISAVARIGAAFEEFGGALLFDAVGVGKTYIGAAVAGKASDALVVAPATLRSMWKDAAQRADLKLSFVSTESLSVTEPRSGSWDIVVVDEAHHFRNPNTKRHRRLAEIVRGRRALLMSATPIHNSRNDLVSVASLFLGARAGRLSDSELGRLIIRRDREEAGISAQFPVEESTEWITGSDRPEIVDAIRALPPPLPLRDAGEATELISRGLVRQWASSEHALAAALRRRLLSAVAMESSLESGRHPSRAELESWLVGDEGVQLGFAELLSPIADAEVGDLLAAVRQHSASLRSLLELLGRTYSMDAERAQQSAAFAGATPVAASWLSRPMQRQSAHFSSCWRDGVASRCSRLPVGE